MPNSQAVTLDTADGPFTIMVGGAQAPAVIAAGWHASPLELLDGIHATIRPTPSEIQIFDETEIPSAHPVLAQAARAVAEFYQGDPTLLPKVPVLQVSSPFRMEVWDAMRALPAGEVYSYGEVAELAGRPKAVRAAASACSHCGVALFVPCHRVVRSDGSIGSFGSYGERLKLRLLRQEGFRGSFVPGRV